MAEKRIGRLRDLRKSERAAYIDWLTEWRKACPILEGVSESEQDGFYVSDYDFFREVQRPPEDRTRT